MWGPEFGGSRSLQYRLVPNQVMRCHSRHDPAQLMIPVPGVQVLSLLALFGRSLLSLAPLIGLMLGRRWQKQESQYY